jgi:prepilin-type N-terminal cleavage/methylation domain-containing protein/prepilin-type processing-associated H-X9-DG protein
LNSRERHGFTLVELLVVIAIMAVLLTLLTPALQRAREQAKATVCQAHVRDYAVANNAYAAEYEDRYVPVGWIGNAAFWKILDVGGPELLQMTTAFNEGRIGDMVLNENLVCPSANVANIQSNHAYPFTYALNNGGEWWYSKRPLRMGQVKYPSEKIVFVDSSDFACNGWMPFTNREVGINYMLHWDIVGDFFGWSDASYPHHGVISYRHGEAASLGMADGHVERRAKEECWIMKENGFPDISKMAIMWDIFDQQVP